jgi:aminoglycoside/choline kinase family phosphotransferase
VTTQEELLAFARESLGLQREEIIKLIPLGKRGSDRAYYRIAWGAASSAILSQYQSSRIENTYYADIACFLLGIGIRVPQIIRHDKASGLLLQEDLGGIDLWTLRESPWETRKDLYQKTLAIVHHLHAYPEKSFPFDRISLMESFGPDLYRWERDYFKNNFLNSLHPKLDARFEEELEIELVRLAERLTQHPRSLVHRDLQSQNVMIKNNIPCLIDFQGMRFGNRFYDLGSLLCDPYVAFTENERLELIDYYYGLSAECFSRDQFEQLFWEASAQRLMQALGAYGFLGSVRGLQEYFIHIPAGLRNLRMAAEHAGSLPYLVQICTQCEGKIPRNPET